MDPQLSASLPAKDASVCPLVVGRRKNPKMAGESLQVPVCSAEEAEAPPTAANLWRCGRHLCFGPGNRK